MAKDGFHANDGLFGQYTVNYQCYPYSMNIKKVRFLELLPHYQAIVFYAKKMVIL